MNSRTTGSPAGIRILMVEDSVEDSHLLLRELERAGLAVTSTRVDTDSDLCAALAEHPWDLVIADYNIPGFSGTAALARVRERHRDLPFIFVSGTIGEEIAVGAMKAGANDYVMKGKLARLVPAIERELREADARRQGRRVETELHRSEERFSKVFHASPIGIALSTLSEGRISEVNEAFRKLLGIEVVGRSLAEIGFWEDPADYESILARLRAHAVVRDLDLKLLRDDGTRVPVLASFECIELGGQQCLISLVHDVSDRARLEEQLRQAQKMEAVGRLAGGVAHDFNNLLTVILGSCALMRDAPRDDAEWDQSLVDIQSAAQRAADLTRQLLAFSRKQVIQPRALDLNAIVAGLEPMLRRLIPENIVLSTGLSRQAGAIHADSGQVEQVILNLVVNARDAMPMGGDIVIETARAEVEQDYIADHSEAHPGSYVVLVVTDTGIGMDKETQARIFEPFFTTKGPGEGTGLGLSTVYGIVKQSGGFVWVYSEPGRGTAFKVYLPATVASVQPRGPEGVLRVMGGTETILLVEDEAVVRRLMKDLLRRQGYTVLEAPDGVAALEVAAAHAGSIDLVLTDVVMPRMSGRELVERLVESRRGVRVLYTSGYTDDTVIRQGLLGAGTILLEKPFTPDSLLRKVRAVLGAPVVT